VLATPTGIVPLGFISMNIEMLIDKELIRMGLGTLRAPPTLDPHYVAEWNHACNTSENVS
jgi:hypothetical protein